MKNGAEEEVICTVSFRILLALGETVGANDAQTIFRGHREEIERAASQKYDRTARVPYETLGVGKRDL
jgi:hypothetical protein